VIVTFTVCPGVSPVTLNEKRPKGKVMVVGLPAVGRVPSTIAVRPVIVPALVVNEAPP
jgi:hypothetical protein